MFACHISADQITAHSRSQSNGYVDSPVPYENNSIRSLDHFTLGSKRARLLNYLAPSQRHDPLKEILRNREHSESDPSSSSVEDIFDNLNNQPKNHDDVSTITSDAPTYCDSPISMKEKLKTINQWRTGRRQKLAYDLMVWFHTHSSHRKLKKMYKLSQADCQIQSEIKEDMDGVDSSEVFVIQDGEKRELTQEDVSRDLNSVSVPAYSPLNSLSFESLQELRKEVFGLDYILSNHSSVDDLGLNTDAQPASIDSAASEDLFQFSSSPPVISNETEEVQKPPHLQLWRRTAFKGRKWTFVSPRSENQEDEQLSPQESLDMKEATRSTSYSSTRSSSSSYSIFTVAIPTVRNNDFVANLIEHVSEGQAIEMVYHPEDMIQQNSEESTYPVDIMSPEFFAGSLTGTLSLEAQKKMKEIDKFSTIKFEEYAQLVLYNNRQKLTRGPSLNVVKGKPPPMEDLEGRIEFYKQKCSFKLYDPRTLKPSDRDNAIDLTQLQGLKIPKFSPFSSRPQIPDRPGSQMSILKSSINKNSQQENENALQCDEVTVDEFMDFLDGVEQDRSRKLPYLGMHRKSQVAQYYQTGVNV